MSPELLDPEKIGLKEIRQTKESDCYALGMVIYEVLSEQVPFATSTLPVTIRKVLEGERPERPQGSEGKHFTDGVWRVVQRCWEPQPRNRISAKAILLGLEGGPLPPRPLSNVDVGAETDSDKQVDTTANDSGMFSPFYPRPISNYPRPTTGPSIAHGDNELPLPPRAANPKEGWLVRTWNKATTRKPQGP